MAMQPCKKCLENNWNYKYIDNWIVATCQNCFSEVEFLASKNKDKVKIGGKCRKCDTTLILKEAKFKKQKLKKPYYYTHYIWCPNCKTMYMSDKYKIIN